MKRKLSWYALLTTIFMISILSGCLDTKKQAEWGSKETASTSVDPEEEIEKWRSELLASKKLGEPCESDFSEASRRKWSSENPDMLDGLPGPDQILVAKADFNEDGTEDVLLYFQSENCTGHNGGTPSFAKIIYNDGSVNADLMEEIREAIITRYNKNREENSGLKEMTGNYLQTTTTIAYDNGITGEFRLYGQEDPHCCPTYNGTYTYNPADRDIVVRVVLNEN